MPSHYEQITKSEREMIAIGVDCGMTYREIGVLIGRPGSTIWREVKRNRTASGFYGSRRAHAKALVRRMQPRRERKLSYRPLRVVVEEKLERLWSPDQISGEHNLKLSDDPKMQISDSTIYRHINLDRQKYQPYLRGPVPDQRGRKRKHARIHDRKMIDDRPKVVDERSRAGDYESDSICGPKKSGACVMTHVDRKTYFLVARLLKDRSAKAYNEATVQGLRGLPVHTLTVDNGMEFASFKKLEPRIGGKVFFAHKHSPWQRALNENTNRLLRQYFPKGTNFEDVTPIQMRQTVRSLNERPRKALGYRTPKEDMQELGVAVGS